MTWIKVNPETLESEIETIRWSSSKPWQPNPSKAIYSTYQPTTIKGWLFSPTLVMTSSFPITLILHFDQTNEFLIILMPGASWDLQVLTMLTRFARYPSTLVSWTSLIPDLHRTWLRFQSPSPSSTLRTCLSSVIRHCFARFGVCWWWVMMSFSYVLWCMWYHILNCPRNSRTEIK